MLLMDVRSFFFCLIFWFLILRFLRPREAQPAQLVKAALWIPKDGEVGPEERRVGFVGLAELKEALGREPGGKGCPESGAEAEAEASGKLKSRVRFPSRGSPGLARPWELQLIQAVRPQETVDQVRGGLGWRAPDLGRLRIGRGCCLVLSDARTISPKRYDNDRVMFRGNR